MTQPYHILNWYAGWISILLAFVTGALIGLGFHKKEFMGGYDSFRRRIARLGHIALAALGMMSVIYSLSPWPPPMSGPGRFASYALLAGNITMPLVCFLSAWREPFRNLFFIPVVCLIAAIIAILIGGQ